MSGGKKNAGLGHAQIGEFVEELGLIAFDDQEIVGLFVFDEVSRSRFLSIDRIGTDQGAAQVQFGQKIFESGDFVGFGRDFDLATDDFGLGIQGAEQLNRLSFDFGGGAKAFSLVIQAGK